MTAELAEKLAEQGLLGALLLGALYALLRLYQAKEQQQKDNETARDLERKQYQAETRELFQLVLATTKEVHETVDKLVDLNTQQTQRPSRGRCEPEL